jgi:hypothetical protein
MTTLFSPTTHAPSHELRLYATTKATSTTREELPLPSPGGPLVVIGLVSLLLLVPIVKAFLWKLFSFDRKVSKILHQTKSSEVRLGKITESIAPLLDGFPVDVKKEGTTTLFLGQPIDFVHFDPDEGITFIEVKSGNAKLNTTQRRLKEIVGEGKIRWAEFRLKE